MGFERLVFRITESPVRSIPKQPNQTTFNSVVNVEPNWFGAAQIDQTEYVLIVGSPEINIASGIAQSSFALKTFTSPLISNNDVKFPQVKATTLVIVLRHGAGWLLYDGSKVNQSGPDRTVSDSSIITELILVPNSNNIVAANNVKYLKMYDYTNGNLISQSQQFYRNSDHLDAIPGKIIGVQGT